MIGLKTVEVDFNDLARGRKIRADLERADGLVVGDLVILVDENEELSKYAHLAERDQRNAYFELLSVPRGINWSIGVGPSATLSSREARQTSEKTVAMGAKGLTLV